MTTTTTNPTITASASGTQPERKRVLIAESDGVTRLMLILRFRMAGIAIEFTSNGSLALGKLRRSAPDALLVDLKLTGISGLELIRCARNEPKFKQRPIFVFTHADLIKRGVKKELQKTVTNIFDKSSVCIVDLVRSITNSLTKPAGDQAKTELVKKPVPQAVTTTPQTRALDTALDGVLMQWESLMQSHNAADRSKSGTELLSRVRELHRCADAAGARDLSVQAKAVEGVLHQLCQQAQGLADAGLALITRAVEALGSLACGQNGKDPGLAHLTAAIVDELPASKQALTDALVAAGVKPVAFQSPLDARKHLASHSVDLIIANVGAPELHGLALTDIRQLPLHATTPVIFVPESSVLQQGKDALPTSASPLNLNALFLAEIVMKAINQVQNADAPTEQEAPPPEPQAVPSPSKEGPRRNAAAEAFDLQSAGQPLFFVPTKGASNGSEPAAASTGAPSSSRSSGAAQESNNGSKTILFVEDDPFALKLYKKALARSGFQVEVAEDGQAAIEMLPRLCPDLVVLDLMLPKVHGLDVLKFIRSDSTLKDTPVLVLSNAYLEHLAAKARQSGANEGLSKAKCTPDKLVERVCVLLGRTATSLAHGAGRAETEAVLLPDGEALAAETAIWVRQSGLRKEAPREIAQIRQICLECIKMVDPEKGLVHLTELYRRIRFLSAHAALIGFTKIADVSSALEGLLFEIMFNQLQPTSSTFQTIAQGVDLLDQIVRANDTTYPEPRVKSKLLVTDSDSDSNLTLVTSLQRGYFDVVGVQDPIDALRILKADQFNLVLLDIHTPHLNGFEICEQLRRQPRYQAVPVILLAPQVEFQQRARSVIAGANDLIAKTVSPLELILKVTFHLLKPQSQGAADANAPGLPEGEEMPDALNARWSVEAAFNEAQNALGREESRLALANGSESIADLAVAGGIVPANHLEATTALSGGTISEEHSFEVAEQRPHFTNAPGGLPAQPAPEGGLVEGQNARVAASDAIEPPTALQHNAEADANGERGVPGSEADATLPEVPTDAEKSPDAIQGEETDAGMSAKEPGAPAKFEDERERLVNRIYTAENNLHRAEARIKRRDAAIESLQKQLEEFTALKSQLEQAKAQEADEGIAGLANSPSGQNGNGAPTPTEVALQEAQARTEQLEKELAKLRQERAELEAKVLQEQQAGAEASKRLQELEGQLSQRAAEWEKTKADSEKQAKELQQQLEQRAAELEQARSEAEKQGKERAVAESALRQQLEAVGAAAKQGETAQKQAQARCTELEQELGGLRQAREALHAEFNQEQQASAENSKRAKELEKQLEQRAAELEQARSEAEKQAQERGHVESELRQKLETASAAAQQGETAHKQAQARCTELEQELAGLRQAREALHEEFKKEHQTSTESGKRAKELEQQLEQRAAQLEQARNESERQAKERERVESELRQQLEAASAAAKQGETAHNQSQARCAELEQALAGLRQAREALHADFNKEQQATAEFSKRAKGLEKQLEQRAAELEQARNESAKQAKERAAAESQLQQQLEAASAAAKQGETAHKQAATRCNELERELTELRHRSEDLRTNFAQEHRAGAELRSRLQDLESQLSQRWVEHERDKAASENQLQERVRVESDLRRRLEAAAAAARQGETAHKQAQARCAELERELAGLREAREELNAQFTKEQQASAESGKRLEDLEKQLTQRGTELQRAHAESEKQAKERARVESELRQQLDAAGAAAKQADVACKQAQALCAGLEKDLAEVRAAREQLNVRFTKEQHASAESGKRLKDLEKQLTKRATELERAHAESEKQAKERARVESELRQQLDAAGAAAKQGEAAHKQAQARCAELEKELAQMRAAREQLNVQFTNEQHASAESGKRLKDLEKQLTQRGTELERAHAESEKQAKERARVESELRQQLDAAGTAAKQGEAAYKQAQARCAGLEKDLAEVRAAREQLNVQFTNEQHASAESGKRLKDLEKQLTERGSELERALAESKRQAEEHRSVESELRQQLDAAGTAAKQGEAAYQQAQAICAGLEKDLAEVRAAREQLNVQFRNEQQLSAESGRRVKDLEKQLTERGAELERALAESKKQAEEHRGVESELRQQLDAAGTAAKQGEAAYQQAQAICAGLEKDLAEVRAAREQLNVQFRNEQQLSAESGRRVKDLEKQLTERGAELERALAESKKQAEEHGSVESELRRQLDAAGTAAKQGEAAYKQAQALRAGLEKDLAEVRAAREQLNVQFTNEQQLSVEWGRRVKDLESQLTQRATELERAITESEKQAEEHGRLESGLRQKLEAAGVAHHQAQSRVAQLEQQLGSSQRAGEELNNQLAQAHYQLAQTQQSWADSARKLRELENQFNVKSADLERANGALQKQAEQHERAESDLRALLQAAGAAHNQAQLRVAELEQQLSAQQQARAELEGRLATAQQRGLESSAQIKQLERQLETLGTEHLAQTAELERRLEQNVAALARVTGELAKERGQRERGEARAAELNRQLQELHQESKRLLECHRLDQERLGGLESQLHQREDLLTRRTAALEHEQAERQLTEEQLDGAKELNARLRRDLSLFEEAHQTLNTTRQELQSRLEATLNSLQATNANLQREAAEHESLASALDKTQRELQYQSRQRATLETELHATRQALQERESKWQEENTQRRRLSQALEAAQLAHEDYSQRNELELANLRATLQMEQVERQRQHTQSMRLRQSTLASARSARVLRSALRRQLRERLDDLYQSSRSLLQFDLGDEQRKLAETILGDVFQVQARLQESEAPGNNSSEPEPGAENGPSSAQEDDSQIESEP